MQFPFFNEVKSANSPEGDPMVIEIENKLAGGFANANFNSEMMWVKVCWLTRKNDTDQEVVTDRVYRVRCAWMIPLKLIFYLNLKTRFKSLLIVTNNNIRSLNSPPSSQRLNGHNNQII